MGHFRFLVDFSKRPEASSAGKTVSQLLELANEEKSETGDMFIEAYKAEMQR